MSGLQTIAVPPVIAGSGLYDSLRVSRLSADLADIGTISITLPAPLQSIADLTTSGNEIIYTIASDTYATSGISALGRSFVSLASTFDQREALGLQIGIDVQAQSNILDDLITVASVSSQLVYTVGGTYSNTALSTFTKDNILNVASAAALNGILGTISGTVSTDNTLVKVSGSNAVEETGIVIDDSDNISGIVNLTLTGTLGGITSAERTQLTNINATTISSTQWGYLGDMDQGLTTTDTPTFTGLNANSQKITAVLNPTNAQDAATKDYVDTVASSGAAPLESVALATSTVLPNTPTYASPAETLTAGANANLVVDTVATSGSERVLVKDQADNRENGVYTVTTAGSGATPWVLTRATDFDQAAMPLTVGTPIFVELTAGAATNPGSSWALGSAVTNVDPLTDAVTWVQTGGGTTYTAGTGIDATSLVGGTIQADISARLKITGNDLDLNTVTVPYGGTGQVTLGSGNVLVGAGTSAVTSTKAAPTGDFVGTSDSQTLTNKTATASTNNIAARSLLSNSGANAVSTFAASNPTNGQVLTATGTSTATWQSLSVSNPDRTIRVYQSAPNSNNNYTTIDAAITQASTLTPTAADPVAILVFPGTYAESTPLVLPAYVTITGQTRQSVIVTPTAPAPAGAIFQLNGNSVINRMIIDGNDGASGYSTIGINSSVGTAYALDNVVDVTVRNCSTAGIRVVGNAAQYSKILILDNVSVLITAASFTMTSGIEVEQGGILSGVDLTVSGFLAGGSTLTNGYYIHDDFSFLDCSVLAASSVTNGLVVGGGVSSNSQGDYPISRIVSGKFGFISGIGIKVEQKAVLRLSDVQIDDDTGTFANQIHLNSNNPSLPANANFIAGLYVNLRTDLITVSGATNNPLKLRGANLSETPGETSTNFRGEVAIGGPNDGYETIMGEGDSTVAGMIALTDDGGAFTVVTPELKLNDEPQYFTDIATTGSIDLASAPATIDGVTPTTGVTRVLVKDGSTANPGSSSIDNGIYVWNGTGAAMTRASDFNTGDAITSFTWIAVDQGTTNYRSRWKVVNNITAVGTTAFSLSASSILVFPLSPANDDALYIGNVASYQFVGLKVSLSAPLTVSSGEATDAIVWEYWNGSAWTTLPLMSTFSGSPYDTYGNQTFGYSDTITATETFSYQYRFGDINSLWSTTTINGTLAYWVRARVTDSTVITQVPSSVKIKLSTNRTEVNADGFVEFFGNSRPVRDIPIDHSMLVASGLGGEFSPDSNSLTISNTGGINISASVPNCRWRNTRVTTVSFPIIPHKLLDSSIPMKFRFDFINDTTAGPANIAFKVDYAYIGATSQVGVPGGTVSPDFTGTTGYVAYPVSTLANGWFNFEVDIDIQGLKNNEDSNTEVLWFKLSRDGPNVLDTYADNIYLNSLHIEHAVWCVGGYYVT